MKIDLTRWPLLLGAALCLPFVLRSLLAGLGMLVPPTSPRLSWLLSDGRWLLGPASLALMALTLALVAAAGTVSWRRARRASRCEM